MAQYLTDFRQGDTYRVTIQYPLDDVTQEPTDITGFKFWFVLKRAFDDADADAVLWAKSVAGSAVGDEPLKGLAYVVAHDTWAVPPGEYYYALKVLSASGEGLTLAPPPNDYKDRIRVVPAIVLEHS